jgi:hypothetical protein
MNDFNIIVTSILCICFYVVVFLIYRDHAPCPAQSQLWLAFKSGSLPTLALTSLPAPTADCDNLLASTQCCTRLMHRYFVEVAWQTNLSARSLDRYFVSSVCDRICLTRKPRFLSKGVMTCVWYTSCGTMVEKRPRTALYISPSP